MPWGRVDDDFYDHPKVTGMPAEVRNAACGLYWRAISYCNRYLTDGRLTPAALTKIDGCEAEVEALLVAGLFERPKANGKQSASQMLRVHDFLHRNKSRRQVLTERIQKAAAGRIGGVKSGEKRRARSSQESPADLKQSASAPSGEAKQSAPLTHAKLEADVKQSASPARSKTEAAGVELPSRPNPIKRTPPKPPAERGARDRSRRDNGETARSNGRSPRQLREGSRDIDAKTLASLAERTAAWNAAHPGDQIPAPQLPAEDATPAKDPWL